MIDLLGNSCVGVRFQKLFINACLLKVGASLVELTVYNSIMIFQLLLIRCHSKIQGDFLTGPPLNLLSIGR